MGAEEDREDMATGEKKRMKPGRRQLQRDPVAGTTQCCRKAVGGAGVEPAGAGECPEHSDDTRALLSMSHQGPREKLREDPNNQATQVVRAGALEEWGGDVRVPAG